MHVKSLIIGVLINEFQGRNAQSIRLFGKSSGLLDKNKYEDEVRVFEASFRSCKYVLHLLGVYCASNL